MDRESTHTLLREVGRRNLEVLRSLPSTWPTTRLQPSGQGYTIHWPAAIFFATPLMRWPLHLCSLDLSEHINAMVIEGFICTPQGLFFYERQFQWVHMLSFRRCTTHRIIELLFGSQDPSPNQPDNSQNNELRDQLPTAQWPTDTFVEDPEEIDFAELDRLFSGY